MQWEIVIQRISLLPPPTLPSPLQILLSGLPIHTQEWVIKCIATCSSLPANFFELAAMLEQLAAGVAPSNRAWADLLAAFQGNSSLEKHTKRLCVLADLAPTPETALHQLFCQLSPKGKFILSRWIFNPPLAKNGHGSVENCLIQGGILIVSHTPELGFRLVSDATRASNCDLSLARGSGSNSVFYFDAP